jgi:hypothetical protein
MCGERIQRFLMAIVLTVAMVLFAMGETGWGVIIQTFVIFMIVVWALPVDLGLQQDFRLLRREESLLNEADPLIPS